MIEERTIDYLEKQLKLSAARESYLKEENKELRRDKDYLIGQVINLSGQVTNLSGQVAKLTNRIDRLTFRLNEKTQTIDSLEEALLQKDRDISTLTGKNRGLTKLLGNKSEKITPEGASESASESASEGIPEGASEGIPEGASEDKPAQKAPSPKERGNNGAKRKVHFNLEEEIIEIWPDNPQYDESKASEFKVVESIRYAYYPPRFVKKIIRQHKYVYEGKIYEASAPRTPLLNSNYEASFIAGLFQFKYMYSMPVERILHFFSESGFELEKPTAHSLIGKTANMLDCFYNVLRQVIHTDRYIRIDETYHQIINEEKNKKGKATRKGYIWVAMADTLRLVHFFYKDGSRCKEVFEGYLDKGYQGAVHTDGLSCYKAIETDAFPNAIRISCAQHAKRYFLEIDLEKDAQAKDIVDHINLLYKIENKMLPEWNDAKKLEFRNEEAAPVLKTIEDKLLLIQKDPATIPSTPLAIATNYMLNELDAIKNYLLDITYTLDNNPIERINRYISLNRRNSLFFGSHKGAERSALLFSLACSCRLHKINPFEYFTDLLTRMAYMKPNQPYEVLRELLPDKWKKSDPEIYSDA